MSLPESWLLTSVESVCSINPKLSAAEKPDDETPITFVPMSALDENNGTIAAPETKTYAEISKGYSVFKEKDVLFAKVTACMENGKAAVVSKLENNLGFGSTEFHVLRPSDNILPEYLFYFVRQQAFRDFAKSAFVGTGGLQRVPTDFFRRVKIPLPTLSEQQRIVAILQQLEAIENERTRALKSVSSIAREHFIAMFGHPAENPHGFKVEKFSKLGTLDRGISKHRPLDAAHLYNGPYPFIQTGDVSNAGDWITEHKSTYSEAGLEQSRLWPAGTLCITIAANIARVAILGFDACFPDSVVGFLPKEGVTNEYILYCLRFYQEYFEFRAPKSAQMNINLEILRQLKIPNPPEHLQKEFSEVVQCVRNLEESIGRQLNKHHELLNEIFIAAFSGELTETWRNKNQTQIQAEAEARADRLALTAKPLTLEKPPAAAKKSSPAQSRLARLALFGELSEFQRFVFDALHEWPAGILVPDDSAAFEDFCRQWPVEHERNTQDRARRALDQLAALGLIAKVSLPNPQGQYLTAYRMLREGDERRTGDIAAIGRSREMA